MLRSYMSPTHQDLSNDTTFSQIKSRVPVPLNNSCIIFFTIKAGKHYFIQIFQSVANWNTSSKLTVLQIIGI